MTTPAEHYAKAEQLLALPIFHNGELADPVVVQLVLAEAQVHATLATVPLFTATTVTESTP